MTAKERNATLATLDYTLSTRALAAISGIEKRHITEYRKKHGKGRATQYTPHENPRKMRVNPRDVDWSKSKRELSAELGVSVQRCYQLEKMLLAEQYAAMVASDTRALVDALSR